MQRLLVSFLAIAFISLVLCGHSSAQVPSDKPTLVSFSTKDDGLIYANLFGKGERGLVLAHGGRFNKESWEKQIPDLVKAGFRVLAIDFRGLGQSHGAPGAKNRDDGVHFDVLAAIRYLRDKGLRSVSVIGASFGGGAAAEASMKLNQAKLTA